jgi:hypothetical protein
MSFHPMAAVRSDFPNPAEQAQAILEISDANIQVARSLVWARIRFATNIDEIRYWVQVERLVSNRAASFDTNAPSDKEAER